jgi:prepilin-type N-terminal cleavage/methylation domain-containing protein
MKFRAQHFHPQSAFTMVEIAISLAIISIALLAIVGVLPIGMNVQRDTRETTIINQDATIFIEAISKGASGDNDLTNYVYQVGVGGINGVGGSYFSNFTSGAQIIGLLTTPGQTNHAYVRSISGPAVEKPPQDNQILQQDTFSYRVVCENVPVQSAVAGNAYVDNLQANLHELRLTFLWPVLPNGNLPSSPARQTFRALVAGQIAPSTNNYQGQPLYFFQPQSFTSTP